MDCVAVAMEYIANIMEMSSPNFSMLPWRTTFEMYFFNHYGKEISDVGLSPDYLDSFMQYCFNAVSINSVFQMIGAIETHSPIFAVMNNAAGKHAVTIVGYYPKNLNFIYIDPSDGLYHKASFLKFSNMYIPKRMNLKSRRKYKP